MYGKISCAFSLSLRDICGMIVKRCLQNRYGRRPRRGPSLITNTGINVFVDFTRHSSGARHKYSFRRFSLSFPRVARVASKYFINSRLFCPLCSLITTRINSHVSTRPFSIPLTLYLIIRKFYFVQANKREFFIFILIYRLDALSATLF